MACTRALPKMTGRFEETHHDRSWSLASCRGLRPRISGGRICPVSSAPTDPDAGGAGPGDFAAPAAPAPVGPPRRDGDAGRSSRRLPLLLLPGDDADDARAWRGRRPARPGAASGRSAAWPRPRPSRPRPPELGTKPAMSAAPSGLQPVRPGLPTPRPVDPGATESLPADLSFRPSAKAGAASLLSTTGAGVAGIGIGILLASPLAGAGWPLVVAGMVAHGVGMVGNRRARTRPGYRAGWTEGLAYWSCWVGMAAVLGYGIFAAAA